MALVPQTSINGADTARLMTSTALVLLMTLPGVALSYAGMVRKKSVLNTVANVVGVAAVVSICGSRWPTRSPSAPARAGSAASTAPGSRGWTM